MRDGILAATESALRQVEARYLRTERGFHGRFYSALFNELDRLHLLANGRLLEMEYQKSARHRLHQRPDIILHVPAEGSEPAVTENNCVVWALKRHATPKKAREDFDKLDDMFRVLHYRLGIFVNIDSAEHLAESYEGRYADRLVTVAVQYGRDPTITWGTPRNSPG